MVDEIDDKGAGLLNFISSSYRTLQDRLKRALGEQNVAPGAPWSELFDHEIGDEAPATPAEQLMWNAQSAAVLAGRAVEQHLGLLARAYWLDPLYPGGDPVASRWPHSASYASARAALEGTAMMRWILDPTCSRSERTTRSAVLLLWADPSSWRPVVEAAGYTVTSSAYGAPFVQVDEHSRPLSIFKLVSQGHGKAGAKVYGSWSPFVHHSPKVTIRRSRYRAELGQGLFVSPELGEDEHLEVLAQVAEYVAAAAREQGLFFGRDAGEVELVAAEIQSVVHSVLPDIRQQMSERATYEN